MLYLELKVFQKEIVKESIAVLSEIHLQDHDRMQKMVGHMI